MHSAPFPRNRAMLCTVAALAALPILALVSGCGGGSEGDSGVIALPSPVAIPNPIPSPVVSPVAVPSPVGTPVVLPTPDPTPSPTPVLPPLSGESLAVGQGILAFSDMSSDLNIPGGVLYSNSDGFTLGAMQPALGATGNSLQMYFSDVQNGQIRSVTIVLADRKGVGEGATAPLGAVVNNVLDRNAFVLVSTKAATDDSNDHLKQWHSAGGGTITVVRLAEGTAKIRIEGAKMVPYTDALKNGQTGSFTLNGAGFATIRNP